MWVIIDVLLSVVILLVVIANTVRVGNRAISSIRGHQPDLIAPFAITGEEVKDSDYGRKLADMLASWAIPGPEPGPTR
jgi:hypothetical protein